MAENATTPTPPSGATNQASLREKFQVTENALNSVMAEPKAKASWKWRFLYGFSIFLLLAAIGAYGFFTWQTIEFNNQVAQDQEAIAKLDADIQAAEKNADYIKYAWAKLVHWMQQEQQWWVDRLSRIMTVFDDLQSLWGGVATFSDFSIDFSSLHLKGTVAWLSVMYGSWGVIDKFNPLDFIDDITITDYKKIDNGYSFDLVAQILLENVK